ncbi:MAG TPA: tRNA guanosine(34) transglycosylase Tgt [Polyangiaceae bacterium]
MAVRFELVRTQGAARAGMLTTPHAAVPTPCFMPVATQATVKALTPAEVSSAGARMVIMNTYHLWLRPGADLVAEQGGLHEFSRWPHAIATDSGGYQAFSLAERTSLSEAGFDFASHLDGARRLLTPEESMRVQGLLGSDIALQLDVCPPAGASARELGEAVERTTRWARRCLDAKKPDQALFGIVQGGLDVELRRAHARELQALPLDGIALGGFSVGEPPAEMHRVLSLVAPGLDPARPHYLMGVGTREDLLVAIAAGVDMFDCVMPTRNARNGQAFVRGGKLVIKNARYRHDKNVLDPGCSCPACAGGFSRSYIRHLYIAGEILAHRLLSLHNTYVYIDLVQRARQAICEGRFDVWQQQELAAVRAEAAQSVETV